ncbi:MAG: hypothetical protein GQ544_08525 [Candidatus Aminicenantes bacterium]|nr:hypothetical protein [Candidatus Aminicenantes bacterium]
MSYTKQALGFDRRQFFLKALPVCSLMCFGGGAVSAASHSENKPWIPQDKHKFDGAYNGILTNRQYYANRYAEVIDLANSLFNEFGKKRMMRFLKRSTREKMLVYGQRHAERSPDNTFQSYINTFRSPMYEPTLSMEIVEDTEKAFELKVSECIWAEIFLAAEAGDIGYALVCYGDYAWAEGFNSRIEMVRDKTLMQGQDCCNHRYIWKA